jgi:hypothetical protein
MTRVDKTYGGGGGGGGGDARTRARRSNARTSVTTPTLERTK